MIWTMISLFFGLAIFFAGAWFISARLRRASPVPPLNFRGSRDGAADDWTDYTPEKSPNPLRNLRDGGAI